MSGWPLIARKSRREQERAKELISAAGLAIGCEITDKQVGGQNQECGCGHTLTIEFLNSDGRLLTRITNHQILSLHLEYG